MKHRVGPCIPPQQTDSNDNKIGYYIMAIFNQARFVRVTAERDDGFIEFDFSLGDADLYVELIMPRDTFHQFCADNKVTFLDDQQAQAIDEDRKKWSQAGI